MDPIFKDVVEVGAWCAAIIGGLVAAFRAISETAENRALRARELRWKKAQLAREILDRFHANRQFRDALIMLDWSGREFEISPSIREQVHWEELPIALRAWKEPTLFTEKEVYIRDCFDQLFDGFNLLEHYLQTRLLEFVERRVSHRVLHRQTEGARRRNERVPESLRQQPRSRAFVSRFPMSPSAITMESQLSGEVATIG